MKKYTVLIEETVTDEFEVYAESDEQAIDIANSKYWGGDFVLAPGELLSAQVAIVSSKDSPLVWVEV